jgi:hypothetical protein
MKTTNAESDRISMIISSAQIKSWEKFKSLSDEEFSHKENMRHQFVITSQILIDMDYQWDLEINIIPDPPDARMIHVQLNPREGTREPIILLLRSSTLGKENKIGIISFYENYTFS